MSNLTVEAKKQLQQAGSIMSEMPKGIPKVKYYTPDGREELKIPQQRQRQDGVIYDIFLAQGYTLTPPENPKPYCKGCDKWHDTQEQVDECIGKKTQFVELMNRKAQYDIAKEQREKDKRIDELEIKIDRLTKLLEAKLGKEI